jgi:putative transposase
MVQKTDSKQLKKSIADVAWTSFFKKLSCKAEEAGRIVIPVNPAYTSQDCSGCGHRKKKTLAQRIHKCKECGLKLHRDLNAAHNILRLGLQSLGLVESQSSA